ncbi:hypothetical protein D3C85_1162000 [compost metagenome]
MRQPPGNTSTALGLTAFPVLEQGVVDEVPGHGDGSDHYRQRPGIARRAVGQVGQAQGRHAQADQFIGGHIDQFAFDTLHVANLGFA